MSEPRNIGRNLLKETLIYSVGSFGSRVLIFILVPLYTGILSKKEIGEYDILITTVSLFIPLASLQISDAVYRWLIENEQERAKIISNSLMLFGLGYCVFALFFYSFTLFFYFEYKNYFIVLLFLNALLPVLQNILRGQGQIRQFSINGITTACLVVLSNIVFVWYYKLRVEGIILANIVAYFFSCLLILIKIKITDYFHIRFWDLNLVKKMCLYSLPLIPNLMGWWFIGSASKFLILHFLGAEANGVYAISYRFASFLVIVNSVLVLPIQDAFLKENAKPSDFREIIIRFVKIEFSLIVLLIVLAPFYTKWLVNSEFYDSWKYMPFLFLGVGFNTVGALIGLVYQKKKNTIKITSTILLGGIISLVLTYFGITKFGLLGVSVFYLIGFLVMCGLRYFDVGAEFDFQKKSHIKLLIATLCVFILVIVQNMINFDYQLIIAILVIFGLLLFNKSVLVRLMQNVSEKIKKLS